MRKDNEMFLDPRAVINKIAGMTKTPEGYKGADGLTYCLTCGKPLEMRIDDDRTNIHRTVPIMCDCAKKAEAALQERMRLQMVETERLKCFSEARQGMADRLKRATFESDKGYNEEAMKIAKGYVKTFEDLRTGLLLYGSVGSGKSFIAACICNALIDKGHSARFTSFIRIAGMMQASFNAREEVMKEIIKPDLLVLDDLGAERDTEYLNEIVYAVIEARYQYNRPMVITTNLTAEDLTNPQDLNRARVYDRILECCEPVEVIGKSLRRAGFNERHSENIERMKAANG